MNLLYLYGIDGNLQYVTGLHHAFREPLEKDEEGLGPKTVDALEPMARGRAFEPIIDI